MKKKDLIFILLVILVIGLFIIVGNTKNNKKNAPEDITFPIPARQTVQRKMIPNMVVNGRTGLKKNSRNVTVSDIPPDQSSCSSAFIISSIFIMIAPFHAVLRIGLVLL